MLSKLLVLIWALATINAHPLLSSLGDIALNSSSTKIAGLHNVKIHPSRGGQAVCTSGIIDVQASTTRNLRLNFNLPENQLEATDAFVKLFTPGSPFTRGLFAGTQEVSGTYEIGASICTSPNASSSTIQILTHGGAFDRKYWDFAPGYSYVDVAVQNGYTVLLYDRLGVGLSSRPDPIQQVQLPLQIEIAAGLVRLLRSGSIGNASFSKFVGVGHSFGSVITQSVTRQYPDLLDAAVLTGYATNASAFPTFLEALNLQIASENQPYRFADLNSGYLVASSAISNQISFFAAPGFDTNILAAADSEKNTVTFGEFFSLQTVTGPAANYTRPLAVVNGDADLAACAGNCTSPYDAGAAVIPTQYPRVPPGNAASYIAPNTGHGLNLHFAANDAFVFVQKFLKQQGL